MMLQVTFPLLSSLTVASFLNRLLKLSFFLSIQEWQSFWVCLIELLNGCLQVGSPKVTHFYDLNLFTGAFGTKLHCWFLQKLSCRLTARGRAILKQLCKRWIMRNIWYRRFFFFFFSCITLRILIFYNHVKYINVICLLRQRTLLETQRRHII